MSAIDMKAVEEKVAKGEALTAAELKEVMSAPPEGESNILPAEDDIKDTEYEEGDPDADKAATKAAEAQKAKDKADADKAAKDAATASAKAKEGKVETTEEFIDRYNKAAAMPEGQEDLTGWTEAEKGYFRQMKSERKRAQKAEEDLDVLKREKLLAKQKEDKAKADALAKEEDEIFKDRNPDDALTVKDLKALMDLNKKKTPLNTESRQTNLLDPNSPIVASALLYQEQVAKKELGEDYDETVECAQEIIFDNPAYLDQLGKALVKGENVAKLTYELIKKDPEYKNALPAARARLVAAGKKTSDTTDKKEPPKAEADDKTKAALKAQEQLEANKNKSKTSAHIDASGEEKGKMYGDYTADQLTKMSDVEFRKVPKKTRDAFMKELG